MKIRNKKSAFSLVEISVVMVIIGLLVTGIIGGQALMNYAAFSKARGLTNSAPVSAIEGVQLWLETTSKKSFNVAVVEGTEVQTWNDINPQGLAKKNATQSTATQIPTYKTASIEGLPTMRFDGNDTFILPDGTVPSGNQPYTVFIVSRLNSGASGAMLGAGDSPSNQAFRLLYNSGQLTDGWHANEVTTTSTYAVSSPVIYTFRYDNSTGVGRTIHINGAAAATNVATATDRATLSTNNRIGGAFEFASLAYLFTGDIGEIIVYNVALDNIDRASIEKYLSQKWGINIAS